MELGTSDSNVHLVSFSGLSIITDKLMVRVFLDPHRILLLFAIWSNSVLVFVGMNRPKEMTPLGVLPSYDYLRSLSIIATGEYAETFWKSSSLLIAAIFSLRGDFVSISDEFNRGDRIAVKVSSVTSGSTFSLESRMLCLLIEV